jgi:hypothetical protein
LGGDYEFYLLPALEESSEDLKTLPLGRLILSVVKWQTIWGDDCCFSFFSKSDWVEIFWFFRFRVLLAIFLLEDSDHRLWGCTWFLFEGGVCILLGVELRLSLERGEMVGF